MNHFPNFDTSSTSSTSEEEQIVVRRLKIYNVRKNYFEIYDDTDFYDRFCLHKQTVEHILQQIQHLIKLPTNRGGCISPIIQLLLTLRFFALGDMQIAVDDFMGISRASACRIIKRAAIASLCPEYIHMPNNEAQMERSAAEFYEIASFPKLIGAIDCTLIRIDSPGGHDAEIFRCRKSFFAINVQTVSDAKLKIRDIVARWPGSTHDQTIFNNSNLKRRFEAGNFGRYLLIGDSGYALQPYLMTQLQHTRTAAENLYNGSIIRTHNAVERQHGIWKRRFPILRLEMRMKLDTVLNVIVATAVLHNIAIDMNEEIPMDWLQDIEEDNVINMPEADVHRARLYRQLLINEDFAHLL